MTGKFTEKNPRRCAHYARFLSKVTLLEANLIFWTLFVLVIVLMCIASWQHHKSSALTERDKKLPSAITSSPRHKLKTRRKRLTYLGYTSLCFVLSAASAVIECFALFHIEFCDGEDLIMMYWGFWSVLQLGSIIAIAGVMVQFWIVLGDLETPSWAVAMGTPVLVFAALGFVIRDIILSSFCRANKQAEPDIEARRGSDDTVVGGSESPNSNFEIDAEKYANNQDRRMSNAPTVAPPLTPTMHHAAVTVPPEPPVVGEDLNVGKHSTFWQRDLRNLLNSVLSNPPREDS